MVTVFFFFFSSRRRHTRLQGDWSSDVCSSDLAGTCQVTAKTTVAGSYTSGASIASGALSGSGVSSGGNTYGATAAYVFTAGGVDPANSTMSGDVDNQAARGGPGVGSVGTKEAVGEPGTRAGRSGERPVG